jgi:hypothetical protein
MKIKFEWEVINEKRGSGISDVTLRAKTIGGWVVKSVYVEGGEFNCKSIREHALVFIPDYEHKWEI